MRPLTTTKQCSVCDKPFTCGHESGQSCWCGAYPTIMPLDFKQGCQCPECLAQTIGDKLDEFIDSRPLEEVVEAASKYRSNVDLVERIDFKSENGRMVFSRWYHIKRGSCCDNDCKNCPY